jgi:hypothetical protein
MIEVQVLREVGKHNVIPVTSMCVPMDIRNIRKILAFIGSAIESLPLDKGKTTINISYKGRVGEDGKQQ